MTMRIDPDFRDRGEFPIDRPLEALRTDHALARRLFERYFNEQDADERRELGRHILVLLDMHTVLEERAFYPRVQNLDPSLVAHCEHDHDDLSELTDRLGPMDLAAAEARALYDQLAQAFEKHAGLEERDLFTKVEGAGLDLNEMGREMQTLESTMIADRIQKATTPHERLGRRRTS